MVPLQMFAVDGKLEIIILQATLNLERERKMAMLLLMSPCRVIAVRWIVDYELITFLGPERLILRVFLFRTWAKHMEL